MISLEESRSLEVAGLCTIGVRELSGTDSCKVCKNDTCDGKSAIIVWVGSAFMGISVTADLFGLLCLIGVGDVNHAKKIHRTGLPSGTLSHSWLCCVHLVPGTCCVSHLLSTKFSYNDPSSRIAVYIQTHIVIRDDSSPKNNS